MVKITRVSTRRGDKGKTHLADLSRVTKTDPRIKAVGSVSEANAWLGLARAAKPPSSDLLERLQQELFDLGADLAMPMGDPATDSALRVSANQVVALEAESSQISQALPPLDSFVLPGGNEAAARLHLAATVLRRAEQDAWVATENHGLDQPGGLSSRALQYLNRISDLVFLLARQAAAGDERLWETSRDT